MVLLFKDYTDKVTEDYKSKKEKNKLSHLLVHPTTGNLRNACLKAYNRSKPDELKRDGPVLEAFFSPPREKESYRDSIESHDVDKFRPLVKFMENKIKNPSEITVELLAWLLDFQPRPFIKAQKEFEMMPEPTEDPEQAPPLSPKPPVEEPGLPGIETPVEGQGTIEGNTITENVPKQPDHTPYGGPVSPRKQETVGKGEKDVTKKKLRLVAAGGMLMASVFAGMYAFKKDAVNKCMVWSEDRYAEVRRNEVKPGQISVAFDERMIRDFRRIMRMDTITQWSVGKLYYIKNDNALRCYNGAGNFPEDPKRSLKILSQSMFDKYIKNADRTDSLSEISTDMTAKK